VVAVTFLLSLFYPYSSRLQNNQRLGELIQQLLIYEGASYELANCPRATTVRHVNNNDPWSGANRVVSYVCKIKVAREQDKAVFFGVFNDDFIPSTPRHLLDDLACLMTQPL